MKLEGSILLYGGYLGTRNNEMLLVYWPDGVKLVVPFLRS